MMRYILILIFALVGCAHGRKHTTETPIVTVTERCQQFVNGSTDCETFEKWEVDPGHRGEYGYEAPYAYGDGYPPVLLLGPTEGGAAQRRLSGGITILHPADLRSGGDPRIVEHEERLDQHEGNLDKLNRGVTKIARRLKGKPPNDETTPPHTSEEPTR